MMVIDLATGVSLSAVQARLQAHVLHGDAAAMQDVAEGLGLSAARRLGIYHHAYRARLLETMRDTFAHTWRYLGDEWFDHLALAFIEQHTSTRANLRWWGEAWPAWLAGDRLARLGVGAHPEVAELAQLDWALRRAFDAADAEVLSGAALAAVPADVWVGAPLQAQASVAMLTQHCNTLALWHALDQDEGVPEAMPLDHPVSVLVWRVDERPHFRSVSDQEAQALMQLMLGHSFSAICAELADQLGEEGDATSLAASWLGRWLSDGLLVNPASMAASQAAAIALAEHHP